MSYYMKKETQQAKLKQVLLELKQGKLKKIFVLWSKKKCSLILIVFCKSNLITAFPPKKKKNLCKLYLDCIDYVDKNIMAKKKSYYRHVFNYFYFLF